eukprot:GHRQ01039815.1.p1 GENE.GHRQ01039815.1~~GHRQ01039815.1.p1  ORF type:complete len:111 (+),score=28.80 GHRQ01039815.1:190-522(+)
MLNSACMAASCCRQHRDAGPTAYSSHTPTASSWHSLMMLKQRLLGSGFIPSSLSALLMMVVIWPRKKRTLPGSTAPSRLNTDSSALRSCMCVHAGDVRQITTTEAVVRVV